MEFSKNLTTEPIGRKQRERYHAAHTVISFLTERHPIHEIIEPVPSDIPGQIGSVAFVQHIDLYRCADPFYQEIL